MAGFIAGTGKGRNGKGMYGLAPGIKILNISMGQIENKAGNDGKNGDPVEYPAAFPGVVGGAASCIPGTALAHPGDPGPPTSTRCFRRPPPQWAPRSVRKGAAEQVECVPVS